MKAWYVLAAAWVLTAVAWVLVIRHRTHYIERCVPIHGSVSECFARYQAGLPMEWKP